MEARRVLWIGEDARWPSDWPYEPANWSVDCLPPNAAFERLRHAGYDAIVLEFPMPDWAPEALLEETQRLARLGAYQFLTSGEQALPLLEQAVETHCAQSLAQLARHVGGEDWRRFLVGDSQPMRDVCHIIRLVGARRATVLITGETGAGKEMAARALHLAGPRGRGPFVAVNCSALPENLLEDELFGHVRGAFTGAMQSRVGRFEQAHGG